jgi:hypothetical protein
MGVIELLLYAKKAGLRPLSVRQPALSTPVRKFSIEHSIGLLAPGSFPCNGRDPDARDRHPRRPGAGSPPSGWAER